MAEQGRARDLLDTLEDALALLDGATPDLRSVATLSEESFPTLLEECAALVERAPGPEPIRSVHHMACTGGTLICKMLSSMPNVTLLNEIDPLSRMGLPRPKAQPPFRPSDLIFAGRVALRPLDDETVTRVTRAALEEMRDALAEQGRLLCLRDHPHSHYCTRVEPRSRPSLCELLRPIGPVRSVVTVRHPMDSLLSLRNNAWVNYKPDTLEEYAKRYLLFLNDHDGLPVFRYEDFVTSPETVLEQICDVLAVPFEPGASQMLPVVKLSGDSGRSSSTAIAPRPRRPVPAELQDQAGSSPAYQELCGRLGYDP